MRVYHFLNKKFGLENIKERRLKIAIIDELNDPFEFLPLEISNTLLRPKILKEKTEYSKKQGLLCFSKSWSCPVQWAHYADNHQGLCLGFDIPDDHLNKINYSSSRLSQEVVSIYNNSSINENLIKKLLTIKYYHWQYENEFRKFVTLVDADKIGKYFFEYFSDNHNLILKQVIVGVRSDITRYDIEECLGNLADKVEIFKSRPAFKSFRIVRNKDESLWK